MRQTRSSAIALLKLFSAATVRDLAELTCRKLANLSAFRSTFRSDGRLLITHEHFILARGHDRRMGCFGSKPRVARLAMAPAYPGQGDFPHAHYKQAAQPQHAPAFSHQPATTSAPVYYPPPPLAPAPAPSAPPMGPGPAAGGYYAPPPLPTVVPPRAAPPPPAPIPSAPLRHVLGLDATRVGWLAAPDANKVQDYTKRREVIHTGHMLDARGDRAGVICDITPHAIDPAEGLPLSGKATFGSYVTDDHEPVTLGCVEISPKFFNVSGVAITVALRVRLNAKLPTEGCLFYAGDGWRNHISIKHYRGLTLFEACPGNGGDWQDRVECGAKMDLETGKVLSIVAVMEENGVMALYVDGVRVARSNGLADVEGFKITQRQEAWVGRWMRPDQSLPTNAHFFSLDVFDGAMDEDGVRAHHAATVNVPEFKPKYVDPPPLR